MGKKIAIFFFLCFVLAGLAGAAICVILQKAWPVLIGLAALGVCAFPKARQLYRYITDQDDE